MACKKCRTIKMPVGQPGGQGGSIQGQKGSKGDTGLTGATGPQGPQGIQGFSGTNGTNGTNGKGYMATSATAHTHSIGLNKSFLTNDPNLAYTAGARARFTNSAVSTIFMEGIVISYVPSSQGSPLTVDIDLVSLGSTGASINSWNINLAGEKGDQGIQGIQGLTGSTGATGANGTNGQSGVSKKFFAQYNSNGAGLTIPIRTRQGLVAGLQIKGYNLISPTDISTGINDFSLSAWNKDTGVFTITENGMYHLYALIYANDDEYNNTPNGEYTNVEYFTNGVSGAINGKFTSGYLAISIAFADFDPVTAENITANPSPSSTFFPHGFKCGNMFSITTPLKEILLSCSIIIPIKATIITPVNLCVRISNHTNYAIIPQSGNAIFFSIEKLA